VREFLTGTTLSSTIAMLRDETSRRILVVEGHDDHYVLRTHSAEDVIVMAGSGGRNGLLEAAAFVARGGLKDIRFIVDSDLDAALGRTAGDIPNVFVTESHDLVMDLVIADRSLLDRAISVLARSLPLSSTECLEVRLRATEMALTVAVVRIANERHGLGLRLRSFPVNDLVASATVETAIGAVLSRGGPRVDYEHLLRLCHEEQESVAGLEWSVVGDHDFFRSIAALLRAQGMRSITDGEVLTGFLAAVSCSEVWATSWANRLANWRCTSGTAALKCTIGGELPSRVV
jgi:hypothetical protein